MSKAVKPQQISRQAALDVLLGLGLNEKIRNAKNEDLETQLYCIPTKIDKGEMTSASLRSDRERRILDSILATLNADDDLEVVDDEDDEDLFGSGDDSSLVPEEMEEEEPEEELQKEVEDDSDKAEAEYNGKNPKKKVEKSKVELPEVDRAFTFTEISSKLVKCTHKLAKEFDQMELYPLDRGYKKARLEYHRQACANGSFRGPEWASVHVKDIDKVFRMNGKHTSRVLCELYDAGTPYACEVVLRRYECPSMADAAHLFATFDAKDSARSKQDILRGYAASDKNTAVLTPKQLTVVTSAIAFSKMEDSYRKSNTETQSLWLLENSAFVDWFVSLLEGREAKEVSHVMRMSVVAAMLKTWEARKRDSTEFWTDVITGEADEKAKGPRRSLYNLLQTSKVGSRDSGVRIGERELYVKCLKAWNAFRSDEPAVVLSYDKEEKTPVVK